MRILAIGDPHGNIDKIKKINLKKVDLILLTGDLGKADLMRKMFFERLEREKQGLPEKNYSTKEQKRAFMEAFNSTIKLVKYLSTYAPVFIIFGNVESTNQETREQTKKIKLPLPFLYDHLRNMKNVRVINNVCTNFRGLRVGGVSYFTDSGWVRDFKPSNYKESFVNARKESEKVKRVLRKFGEIEILVAHQPPYGILDKVSSKFAPKSWQGKHAGSRILLDFIKKYKPLYVFCGHIHEGEGRANTGRTEVYNLGVAGYKVIELH